MKRLFSLLLVVSHCAFGQINEIPRSTPEQEGVSSEALITTFDSLMALPKTEIHSVMVLRHGKVIGEIHPQPFKASDSHTMFSCSKTFVGTAVGLAVDENRLRLSDRVAALLPEYLPTDVSDGLATLTVKDLLQMTSGIQPDWNLRNRCDNWIQTYLSRKVEGVGKKFQYDSLCSYLLSAIVQKVTGKTVLEYLKIKIFRPMHITDVEWEVSPEGFNTGGWGLRIQSESLAKFGLLLLHEGVWNGERLISSDWVKLMTSRKIATGGDPYCYQMWRCDYPDAYRLDGAFGQYVIIAPKEDMVIVLTECSLIDGKRQRHLFWDHLLANVSDQPLATSSATECLQKKQASYRLPFVKGKGKSRFAKQMQAKQFTLSGNPFGWKSIRFLFEADAVKMDIQDENGVTSQLSLSNKEWIENQIHTYPPYSIGAKDRFKGITKNFKAAGCYGWIGRELNVKLHFTNWMSAMHIQATATSDTHVELRIKTNYSNDWVKIDGHSSR